MDFIACSPALPCNPRHPSESPSWGPVRARRRWRRRKSSATAPGRPDRSTRWTSPLPAGSAENCAAGICGMFRDPRCARAAGRNRRPNRHRGTAGTDGRSRPACSRPTTVVVEQARLVLVGQVATTRVDELQVHAHTRFGVPSPTIRRDSGISPAKFLNVQPNVGDWRARPASVSLLPVKMAIRSSRLVREESRRVVGRNTQGRDEPGQVALALHQRVAGDPQVVRRR